MSSDEPGTALREFCRSLKDLRREAGGPTIVSLDADRTVPLKRSQIYSTLGGTIPKPPTWEFVEAFVRRCVAYASVHQTRLTASANLEVWRREHRRLLELWERRDRQQHTADTIADRSGRSRARTLTMQDITHFVVVPPARRLGIVTGDLRQVRCANVWVNSENTEMEMARVHEFSVSAIIRYEGARHDARGRISEDLVADELGAKVAGHRPVESGSVVVTGAGELLRRNGVRYIAHAAAVQGEPGSGFHPIREIARCVTNVLHVAEDLEVPSGEPVTVLFPMLGAGSAGGTPRQIATWLIHAARNYLRATGTTRIATVYFLAYTDQELSACQAALRSAGLRPED